MDSGRILKTTIICHRAATATSIVIVGLCLPSASFADSLANEMVLTNAAQIRALSQQEAAKAIPVQLTGVAVLPYYGELTLVDNSSGIYCKGIAVQIADLHPGDLVEIKGVTDPGDFAPYIEATAAHKVGTTKIPEPARVTYDDILDGSWDAQWVELTGIVRESKPTDDKWEIILATGGGRMPILLTKEQGGLAAVDARVRLRGVCFYQFNQLRQAVRPVLAVERNEPVMVLEPPPVDPFALPVSSVNNLAQFNPKRMLGHRVHVRGSVIHAEADGKFWVGDESRGINVRSSQPGRLEPGTKVDVLGFVTREGFLPGLEDAEYRVLGKAAPPVPIKVNNPLAALLMDGDLLDLEAKIQQQVITRDGCRLKIVAGMNEFSAFWRNESGAPVPADWQPGAQVRLTGICVVNAGTTTLMPGVIEPQSFEIILRSPADVQILQPTPWWTPKHTVWVLAVALVFSLSAGGSVFWTYRRRSARRLNEVRAREALAEERARIARDLHDDLGANLAEIAMVSELARQALPANDPARSQFDDIFTRAEANTRRLGEIVWSVNPANDTLENFASYLSKFAQDYIVLAGVHCRLILPEMLPALVLTSIQRHQLLLATKEAIHNAILHGKPKTVTLKLILQDGKFQIIVVDDGCGFDEPAVVNTPRGSANMRKRLEAIGGTFERNSAPGRGTTVILGIPFES